MQLILAKKKKQRVKLCSRHKRFNVYKEHLQNLYFCPGWTLWTFFSSSPGGWRWYAVPPAPPVILCPALEKSFTEEGAPSSLLLLLLPSSLLTSDWSLKWVDALTHYHIAQTMDLSTHWLLTSDRWTHSSPPAPSQTLHTYTSFAHSTYLMFFLLKLEPLSDVHMHKHKRKDTTDINGRVGFFSPS